MNLLATSLIRQLLAPVAVYLASDDFKVQVTVAVTAAIAYGWSFIEKKVTGTDRPVK